jgi:hypothetical protein
MHTLCVYGGPAMLLRLIEYQDWRKIGMADMPLLLLLYSIPKIVAVRYVRICARIYAHIDSHFSYTINFLTKGLFDIE